MGLERVVEDLDCLVDLLSREDQRRMRPLDRTAKKSSSAEAFESIATAVTIAGAAGWIAPHRSPRVRLSAEQKVRAATSRGSSSWRRSGPTGRPSASPSARWQLTLAEPLIPRSVLKASTRHRHRQASGGRSSVVTSHPRSLSRRRALGPQSTSPEAVAPADALERGLPSRDRPRRRAPRGALRFHGRRSLCPSRAKTARRRIRVTGGRIAAGPASSARQPWSLGGEVFR